jgi:hypothetical protein
MAKFLRLRSSSTTGAPMRSHFTEPEPDQTRGRGRGRTVAMVAGIVMLAA